MKKIFINTIAAMFICCCGFSQNLQDVNWVFGDSCGLTFNTGNPIFFPTNVFSLECVASISNSKGDLLFYTNGENIWNKENEIMPFGDSIEIGGVYLDQYGSSITQGVIIIPKPGNDHLFYVFCITTSPPNYGIKYSIVDMNLESGKGDVTSKNVQLYNHTLTEQMQAVKHGNGRDWWLLLHEYPDPAIPDDSHSFVRFLITPYGIEGPFYQEHHDIRSIGQMKFSKDCDKLALTNSANVEVFDFDRCTGLLDSTLTIVEITNQATYSCEFSPDGRMIYVKDEGGEGFNSKIYQYCLDCEEVIDSTKTLIYKNIYDDFWIGQLQLAGDNRIYVSTGAYINPNYDFEVPNMNLSVIKYPNSLGLGCDFDTATIYLEGARTKYALPNMPNYSLGALTGSGCDTLVAIQNYPEENLITMYPNPSNGVLYFKNVPEDSYFSIEIIDALGELVYTEKKTNLKNPLDIHNLPQGVYLVTGKQGSEKRFTQILIGYKK